MYFAYWGVGKGGNQCLLNECLEAGESGEGDGVVIVRWHVDSEWRPGLSRGRCSRGRQVYFLTHLLPISLHTHKHTHTHSLTPHTLHNVICMRAGFYLSCSWLHPQCLTHCLVHSRCSIVNCWINEYRGLRDHRGCLGTIKAQERMSSPGETLERRKRNRLKSES